VGRTTLVKRFRDARTVTGHRSYRHVTLTFRMLAQLLYGYCPVTVWVLCPIFWTVVPDFGLTPLTDAVRLAWAFTSPVLALRRAVSFPGQAGGGGGPLTGVRLSGGVRLASRALRVACGDGASRRPGLVPAVGPRSLVAYRNRGRCGRDGAAAWLGRRPARRARGAGAGAHAGLPWLALLPLPWP
jgi:hypothetical protein